MRLTRKKAIELCIELWTWLAKTGKKKEDWPEWEKYKKYGTWHKRYREWNVTNNCWFCEYTRQKSKSWDVDCFECPLPEDGEDMEFRCERGKHSLYEKWNLAKQTRTRKKYAKLFLAPIKRLKQLTNTDDNEGI